MQNEIIKLFISLLMICSPLAAAEKFGFVDEKKKELLVKQIDSFNTVESELALYLAVYDLRVDALKLLIAKGVNIEATPPVVFYQARPGEPVSWRSENGGEFLSNDANVLFVLARHILPSSDPRTEEIFKVLVDAKIDLNKKNYNNETAFMTAVMAGNHEVAKLLFAAGVHVEDKQSPFNGLLYCTTNPNIIDLLLKGGLDINAKGMCGSTPLYQAASHNYDVKHLIARGANPDIVAGDGNTALFKALLEEFTGLARSLIELGADTTISCSEGRTALSLACQKGFVEMVKLLLEVGTPFDRLNSADQTELCVALNEIIRLQNTHTPVLARVKSHPYIQIIGLLLKAGAEYESFLSEQSKSAILIPIIKSIFVRQKIS